MINILIKYFYTMPRLYCAHIKRVRALTNMNFRVEFKYEGGEIVELPKSTYADFFIKEEGIFVRNCYAFIRRPEIEPLMRRIVYRMYDSGCIDKNKSIIDIGCWLSDNAIVWSKLINPSAACVYAVDPSAENLEFGRRLAKINKCNNVSFIKAICADKCGLEVSFEGNINHAQFNQRGLGVRSSFLTETLDNIVPSNRHDSIGLMHLDVEGFELAVINGALDIIAQSMPIIIFEQHICIDDTKKIFNAIIEFDYKIYMINEVIHIGRLDCRNFIAIPKHVDVRGVIDIERAAGREDGIWYATLDNALIPVPDSGLFSSERDEGVGSRQAGV